MASLFPKAHETLYVELTALDNRAHDGRADLSKVRLEAVIVWVIKRKFAPQTLSNP
jgi:hypothetical protein